LAAPTRQSDGSLLTPFAQAQRYIVNLPVEQHPHWVVACNFRRFEIHDMSRPDAAPETLELCDLPREYPRLAFLVDASRRDVRRETEVSVQAGALVGRLYEALRAAYVDPGASDSLHSLNVLCVRLVFCLYAEDSGVFQRKQFCSFLRRLPADRVRRGVMDVFAVLNQRPGERDPYLEEALAAFPYVNGGLFAEDIEIPQFSEEAKRVLVEDCGDGFDWSPISPTVFGAVFESTLNPDTRRAGGMHYTSVENIHKVIDPLFLDGLKNELTAACTVKGERKRRAALEGFCERLGSLRFLDPACGSGNFLTETYLSLRRLENAALREVFAGQGKLDTVGAVRVTLDQFHGIEINDFAVEVARAAMWIAESQMLAETEEQKILFRIPDFLPLRTAAPIVEGNALRLDWEEAMGGARPDFIMGNPPFRGARVMGPGQKDDLASVFGAGWERAGDLDYVACWYKKAADFMRGTAARAAFVSTNYITQGEQTAVLWRPLFQQGVHIDFAHRTFRWDSEAADVAHVHCVIVGFSAAPNPAPKTLWAEDGEPSEAAQINPYLVDAPAIFVDSRPRPLCAVPSIGTGNQPIDGGNYLFTDEEKEAFLKKEPRAAPLFRQWLGADEFINGRQRWCLWLGGLGPAELRALPECYKRVDAVRKFRLASKREGTRRLAERPTRFHFENMPQGNYVVIPEVSSARREYIPMGFMSTEVFCSNLMKIMPDATLYHFGVLTSNVHMA
ncbi:MAG: class I SAM-dependent DNA methyltransferase, partial [Planctomycetes bacterium]|nr:class I SAM-dependent DNA methyltransferase [Planctomycetota bacterium]